MRKSEKYIEFKLFLFVFIFSIIFLRFVSWNEQTRILLGISIVENNSFELGKYKDLTGDRVLFNNKYYSDKAPGTSFIISFIHFISTKIYGDYKFGLLVPEKQFNTTTYTDSNPSESFLLTSFISFILLVSLPSSLLIITIRRVLIRYSIDKNFATFFSLIFFFSTLLLPYSTSFIGYSLSTFLVFLSFYLYKSLNNHDKKIVFLAGVLLGISVFIEIASMLSSIILFIFFLISFRSLKQKILIFFGLLIGLQPILLYNLVLFKEPFLLYSKYVDPNISPCSYGRMYWEYCIEANYFFLKDWMYILPLVLRHVLFLPYRGLLFYMPILILCFLGLFRLLKINRSEFLLILILFISYIFSISSFSSWFGGTSFGLRYFLFVIPFLSIPLAILLHSQKSNPILLMFFVILSFISIFHMLLSLTAWWENVVVYFFPNGEVLKAYWYKGYKFSRWFGELNPLYEHYFKYFMENGLKSYLIEEILYLKFPPDIRQFKHYLFSLKLELSTTSFSL